MTAGRLLLAVDGNSLGHRAFYAYERRGDRTPDGRAWWAVYGFVSLLVGIIDRTSPDAVVVGFDDRNGCARHDRYPDYKGDRGERREELYEQLNALPALLGELGIAVSIPEKLEADDVLASASVTAERAGWKCVLATSDKDSFGLITDATTVLRLMSGGLDQAVRMTPAALFERYHVQPEQWRDYATLIGDKSDHLPGVTGIGEKTAVKLLTACGTLDAALADPDGARRAIGAAGAAKLTSEQAGHAIALNRDMMTPVFDVPIEPARCRPARTVDQITATLDRWHLTMLADRAALALSTRTPPAPELVRIPRPAQGTLECPMPECAQPIRLVRLVTGEFRPIDAEPDAAGTLGWVQTSAGWRMRFLLDGEQTSDARRWTAHACSDQWEPAA
jgi:DNA polymerase-1